MTLFLNFLNFANFMHMTLFEILLNFDFIFFKFDNFLNFIKLWNSYKKISLLKFLNFNKFWNSIKKFWYFLWFLQTFISHFSIIFKKIFIAISKPFLNFLLMLTIIMKYILTCTDFSSVYLFITSILPVSAWLISKHIIITREIRNSQVFQPSMYD